MLERTPFGVAENSQHLYGRALDIRLGTRLAEAMLAARAMRRGGVGWYPQSGFMHIDTGPVRNWDLDHPKLVTLLVGNRRVQFNKRGRMLVSGNARSVGARVQTVVLRGEGPVTVRDRLTRLAQLARAHFAP